MAQKVFLANSVWGSSQQKDRFIKENIWENKDILGIESAWNKIENGDFFLLYFSEQSEHITILAIGNVLNVDGELVRIQWTTLRKQQRVKIGRDKVFFQDLVLLDHEQVDTIYNSLSDSNLKRKLAQFFSNQVNISNRTNFPKHALSNEESDKTLIEKGYQNQGLIGFLYRIKSDISIPLNQYFLNNVEEYFYYINENREDLKGVRKSENKLLGYMATEPAIVPLNLYRYFREKPFWDHFYCTQPEESSIRRIGYDREDNGFKTAYLADKLTKDTVPLYVYSTMPEIKLFREFKEIDTQPILDTFAKSKFGKPKNSAPKSSLDINELIKSKFDSDSKFWFLNDREGWMNHDNSSFYLIIHKNGVYDISKGDLILCFSNKEQSLIDLGEAIEYNGVERHLNIELIHKFDPPIIVQRLNSINEFDSFKLLLEEFHEIPKDLFQEILGITDLRSNQLFNKKAPSNPSKIPQNQNDLAKGDDYLGIDKDVTAFAKIIASNNFTPPLAIALFGQWGSGKSFFMKKLQDRIDQLSQTNSNLYSGGIVHIQFNAWSYIDANLWASIVSRIFDGLNQYINDESSVTRENKKEVKKELSERLEVLKEGRRHFQNQKKLFETKVKILRASKKIEKKKVHAKLNQIRDRNLSEALSQVNREFNVVDRLSKLELSEKDQKAIERFKKLIPERYIKDPGKAVQDAKSLNTFLSSFFKKDRLLGNLLALLLILVVVFGVPVLLDLIDLFDLKQFQLIPQVVISIVGIVVPVWKRIESNYKELEPAIRSLWSIKKQYDIEIESATEKFLRQIEAIKIEIEYNKNEIKVLNEQIITLDSEISILDYKLNNFLSTQSLYNFIEKRAKGDVYKQHLGIISTIRADFEVLSEMFDQSRLEQENERFREYFEKPLERIILYIDDLDRCPEDRVIEVLEAVNLIMAFPLFVVVVGVDHRWVNNALIKQYHFQFKGSGDTSGYQPIEASDYLEKIFQIPFHLNQPEDSAIRNMIQKLSKPLLQDFKESTTLLATAISIADKKIDHPEPEIITGIKKAIKRKNDKPSAEQVAKDFEEIADQFLSLTDEELRLIPDMAGILGSNPRAIKRFVNIYHIVRAHEGLTLTKWTSQEYAILMFLLAFPMGRFKSHFNDFYTAIDRAAHDGSNILLEGFFNDQKKEDLKVTMLRVGSLKDLIGQPLTEFAYRNEFIKRFTFQYTA